MTREIVLILMTSRSGSSMVADIYRRHGFFWASDESKNPLVGRKVRYNSFENQVVKKFMKANFGTPLGDMISFDDQQAAAMRELIKHEYAASTMCVWKGAVEFFPIWWELHNRGDIVVKPVVIWRPMKAVMDSLRAKRQGNVDEKRLVEITDKRYDVLGGIATDHAFPVIETDELVKGNLGSLRDAFDYYGHNFDEAIVRETIKPKKWETDR